MDFEKCLQFVSFCANILLKYPLVFLKRLTHINIEHFWRSLDIKKMLPTFVENGVIKNARLLVHEIKKCSVLRKIINSIFMFNN